MSKTTWWIIGAVVVIIIIAIVYNRNKNKSLNGATSQFGAGVVPDLTSRDDAPTTEQLRNSATSRGVAFPNVPVPTPVGQIICIGGFPYWWSPFANNGQGGWILGTGWGCKGKSIFSTL